MKIFEKEVHMERYLNIVLPKIRSESDFISYLQLLHQYIVAAKNISPRYEKFFLQADTENEAKAYEVPDQFSQFEKILAQLGKYPDTEDTFFLLGIWNGMVRQEDGRSFQIIFSNENSKNLFFDHRANAKFHFPLFYSDFDDDITDEINKLVILAFNVLPCTFITEYDFNYVSQYETYPELIIGSALYGRKTDMDGIEGVRYDINNELIALSSVAEKFDSGNPDHVMKAHAWEKQLLMTPKFHELLLR